MNTSFSHLIWLGAGQAQEPSGLINNAKKVTLVDAREAACEYLRRQFPIEKVAVVQKLLSIDGGPQPFTEYNLPEYSALQKATGLKVLFPGLKVVQQEILQSVSLDTFFQEIELFDDNNALVIDLPDISTQHLATLLKTIALHKLSRIYIVSSKEPLYLGATDAASIVDIIHPLGYSLEQTVQSDPDFPCLIFRLNPLWAEIQQTKQLNTTLVSETKTLQTQQATLNQQLTEAKQQAVLAIGEKNALKQQVDSIIKELDSVKQELTQQQQLKGAVDKDLKSHKQQLIEAKQQTDQIAKERESLKQLLTQQQQSKDTLDIDLQSYKQQLVEAKQLTDQIAKERELLKSQSAEIQQRNDDLLREKEQSKQLAQEQTQQLSKLRADLEQAAKHASTRLDKLAQLEKQNRLLQESNIQLEQRHQAIEQEMIKAEAQIHFIKEFLMKD